MVSDDTTVFTTLDPSSDHNPSQYMVILFGIYFILGFFGNGILVILFLKEKKLRDTNNAFVTNLAFSDLIFVVLFIPIEIYTELHEYRPFGLKFCYVSIIVNFASQDVSALSLAAMSYFRYRAVVCPFQSRSHTGNKLSKFVVTVCILCWVIGICVAIYPASQCYEVEMDNFVNFKHTVNVSHPGYATFIYFRTGVFFILPLLAIAFFYCRMAFHLFRGTSALERNSSISARRALRSRKKLGGIVLAIVALFFISWFPLYLNLNLYFAWKFKYTALVTLSRICMFLPSTFNPVILFATSTGYRKYFLGICSCFFEGRHYLKRHTTLTSTLSMRLSRSRKANSRTSLEMGRAADRQQELLGE